MLLQITTVCNMSCAHCCMSCGKEYKGQHMSQEVFEAALELGSEYAEYIVLSGGEPTLHPHFIKFLAMSIKYTQRNDIELPPWFATNGSRTKLVKELVYNTGYCETEFFEKLYKHAFIEWREGMYSMALSQDAYHDPIDPSIPQLFKNFNLEIRNVTGKEINAGFCDYGEEDCGCDTIQVKPDGDVFLCGCDEAPRIGNVLTGMLINLSELYNTDYCIKRVDEDNDHLIADADHEYTNIQWARDNIIPKRIPTV